MAINAGDARFWNKLARKYAARPVSDVAGYERTLDRVRHYLRSTDDVFEFGCGTGSTALKLAPSAAYITATDISEEMIRIAREKAAAENCANVTFETAAPDSTQWGDAAFDVVLGFNVLHLLRNRPEVLSNLRRVLKPGGTFISKTPCLGDLNPFMRLAIRLFVFAMGFITGKPPALTFLRAQELEREIEEAGFTLVERGYHGSKRGDARPFLVMQKL